MFTSNIRMGKNVISVTLTVTSCTVPDRLVWVFLKCFSPEISTHQSLEFLLRKMPKQTKKNIQWASALQTENTPVMRGQRRMHRLVGADRKSAVAQITTLYSCGEKKSISEWTACPTLSGQATAAEDKFPSCQQRTEIWGCSGHRLNKLDS